MCSFPVHDAQAVICDAWALIFQDETQRETAMPCMHYDWTGRWHLLLTETGKMVTLAASNGVTKKIGAGIET